MSSATIIATERNIEAREKALAALLQELRRTPAHHPKRAFLEKKAKELMGEIAALKASIHYYKSDAQLAVDIRDKRVALSQLLRKAKKARGARRDQALGEAAMTHRALREMLAAAQLKQSGMMVKKPVLPTAPPAPVLVPNEEKDPDLGASGSSDSTGYPDGPEDGPPNRVTPPDGSAFPEAPSLRVIEGGLRRAGAEAVQDVNEIIAKLDEIKLPGEGDEDVPFYKHPLVAFGLGLLVGGILFHD